MLEWLAERARDRPAGRLLAALESIEPATRQRLRQALEPAPEGHEETLAGLLARGAVRELPLAGQEPVLLSQAGATRLLDRASRVLEAYHSEHPLRFAMPREELRGRLELGSREFQAVLPALARPLAERPGGLARAEWAPRPTAAQRRRLDGARTALEEGGLGAPRVDLDVEEVAHLEGAGSAVDCGSGVLLARSVFEEARSAVVALISERGAITLAEARDRLGTSWRVAQALLETLDRHRATRREGEGRVLLD